MQTITNRLVTFHEKLIHWYYRNFYRRKNLTFFCVSISALYFANKFLKMASYLRPRFSSNLLQKYGEDSWAVVTGGSDGIGREFCIQLAREGFHIVVIARNMQKMDDVCKICHQFGVQTMIIQADFEKGTQILYEDIQKQLQGLDVSILVNNVGYADGANSDKLSSNNLMRMLHINSLSSLMMTKIVFNVKRPKRQCIISVASALVQYPAPYVGVYSASKVYQDYMINSLQFNYDQVDFQMVYPLGVTTSMFNHVGPQTTTAKLCVEGTLKDLKKGYGRTHGATLHKRVMFKLGLLTETVVSKDKVRVNIGKGLMKIYNK